MMNLLAQVKDNGGAFATHELALHALAEQAAQRSLEVIPGAWDAVTDLVEQHKATPAPDFAEDETYKPLSAENIISPTSVGGIRQMLALFVLKSLGQQMFPLKDNGVVTRKAYLPPLATNMVDKLLEGYNLGADPPEVPLFFRKFTDHQAEVGFTQVFLKAVQHMFTLHEFSCFHDGIGAFKRRETLRTNLEQATCKTAMKSFLDAESLQEVSKTLPKDVCTLPLERRKYVGKATSNH